MAIGLDVGKLSMANMYDVTNSKFGKHQMRHGLNLLLSGSAS